MAKRQSALATMLRYTPLAATPPIDFGAGWVFDSNTSAYKWEHPIVGKQVSQAVSITVKASVYVPVGIDPGEESPVESSGVVEIDPQDQATLSEIQLDVYKDQATFTIRVDCIDEELHTTANCVRSTG